MSCILTAAVGLSTTIPAAAQDEWIAYSAENVCGPEADLFIEEGGADFYSLYCENGETSWVPFLLGGCEPLFSIFEFDPLNQIVRCAGNAVEEPDIRTALEQPDGGHPLCTESSDPSHPHYNPTVHNCWALLGESPDEPWMLTLSGSLNVPEDLDLEVPELGAGEQVDFDIAVTFPTDGLTPPFVQRLEVTVTQDPNADRRANLLTVELDGRLPFDPQAELASETIQTVFLDHSDACLVDDLLQASAQSQPRVVQCGLTDEQVQTFEIMFISPEIADLHVWAKAFVTSPDGSPVGEVHEVSANPGPQARPVPDLEPSAAIITVIPISPQLGRDEFGDYATRYPFGSHPNILNGDGVRKLLVIGADLPQRHSEADFTGSTGGQYFLQTSLETISPAELPSSLLAMGLRRVYGDDVDVTALLNGLKADGKSAILVEVTLADDVLPGERNLALNGAQANWLLAFADTQINLGFVRETRADQGGGAEVVVDRLDDIFINETVILEAQVYPPELPLGRVPVMVSVHDADGARDFELVDLIPVGNGVYRSRPLTVSGSDSDANRGDISIAPDDQAFATITGTIDPQFAMVHAPFALDTAAQISVSDLPRQTDWDRYVTQAGQCSGYETQDAYLPDLAFYDVAYDGDDPLENLIILNLETVTQDVRVGHHAGLLHLRSSFLRQAARQEALFERMMVDPAYLNQRVMGWREAFNNPFIEVPAEAMFDIDVPAAPLQGSMKLRDVLRFDEYVQDTLRGQGFDDAAIVAWFEGRARAGAELIVTALRNTSRDLGQLDPCDTAGLLRFAKGLMQLADQSMARLTRLNTATQMWEMDVPARRWLRSAVSLAETWDRQQRASEDDTNMFLLVAALATLPLHLADVAVLSAVAGVAEIADGATSAFSATERYQASQQELSISLGMTPLAGPLRYQAARRNEVSGWGAAFEIGLSVFALGFDGYDVLRAARAKSGQRALAGDLAALSPDDRSQLVAYAQDLADRRRLGGNEALSDIERGHLADLEDGDLFTDGASDLMHQAANASPSATHVPMPSPANVPAPVLGAKIELSDEQFERIAVLNRQNTGDTGVPTFIGLLDQAEANVRRVPEQSISGAQAITDQIDADLVAIMNAFDPLSHEHLFAQQALQALRDPSLSVRITDRLATAGVGRMDPKLDGNYIIHMNPDEYMNTQVWAVHWESMAVFAHEAGHMAQAMFQKFTGNIVGRAMREFDSSMRMSVMQNALVNTTARGQPLTAEHALEFSLSYSLQTQLGAYSLSGKPSYFKTADNWFDGMFQLNHTEVLERTRLYFPNMTDKEILDIYVRTNRKYFANMSRDVIEYPLTISSDFVNRYRAMIDEAEAALNQL